MKKAMKMFEKNCQARVASNLIDIYPQPPKPITVWLDQEKLNAAMGLEINLNEAKKILTSLGFDTKTTSRQLETVVPHWRQGDVTIPEDLIEEIARIYGYHQIPSVLPTGQIPTEDQGLIQFFYWEEKTKDLLKDWGLTEVASYSLVSHQLIENVGLQPEKYLQLANPLSVDWTYLRPVLIPSLLQVVARNQANFEHVSLFELANVYLPRGKHKLPEERSTLAIVSTDLNFERLKGVTEALFREMGLTEIVFEAQGDKAASSLWLTNQTATIKSGHRILGMIGKIQTKVISKFEIKKKVVAASLDFAAMTKLATKDRNYQPISGYPAILQDFSFSVPPKTLIGEMIGQISATSNLIQDVKLLNAYQDTRTFRVTFQSQQKTLTDRDVKKIRKKIIEKVRQKFGAHLKQKS
jgi:phenylalanyl-tRNA synthetase beta chain